MKKIILTDRQKPNKENKDVIIDRENLIKYTSGDAYNASLEFMKKLPDLVVSDKSVKVWFKYKNTSLWWFSHTRITPQIKRCFTFIDQFKNMLDGVKPETVEVRGLYEDFDLISQICKKKNVPLVVPFSSKIRIWSTSLGKKIRKITVNTSLIAQQKRRKRISIAKKFNHKISGDYSGCVIYVGAQSYRMPIYDFKSGKILRGEHLVHQVLEIVKKKAPLLCIDIDSTAKGEFNVLKERLSDKHQYWIPLEILFTKELESECGKAIAEIKNNIKNLFKKNEFRKKIEYKNIPVWDSVSYYFETLLSDSYLPNFIRNIEAARNLLARLHPKSILLPYERGPYALAFIVSANSLDIDSVGLQHGIMVKTDQDYAVQNVANSELGFPLPTKMLLFGESAKEVLVNTFSYPPDKIIVVGNPIYDDIEILGKNIDKDAILKSLRLSPTKKTILVGTSMYQKIHGSDDYDVLMVRTIVEKFRDDHNFQIIIKPHPRENTDVYEKIRNNFNITNLIITSTPIQQLFLVCDVFITVMSTTVLEALAMGKPVILMKISDNVDLDYLSITKTGSALEAKANELGDKILKVIEDRDPIIKLKENGMKMVKYHFNFPSSGINEKIANILTK